MSLDPKAINQIPGKHEYEILELGSVGAKHHLGGKDLGKFVPNVNVSIHHHSEDKYHQEFSFLNLNRAGVSVSNEQEIFSDGKIYLQVGDQADEIYQVARGLEWTVHFASKPSILQQWNILCSPDVEFYYQPELTQEEVDAGDNRPVDVIGSYAVRTTLDIKGWWARDSSGLWKHKCGTGKLGHIYRPKIVANDGKWVWCSLNITKITSTTGTLEIIIPKAFLDTAQYPIRLEPVLGSDTCGGSGINANAATYAHSATAPENGDFTDVGVCVDNSGLTAKDIYGSIYKDAGGGADSQLKAETTGTSDAGPFECTAKTITYTYANEPVNASTYWFAFSSSSSNVDLCYDDATGDPFYTESADHPINNDWSEEDHKSPEKIWSIWGVYTAAAAAGHPTMRRWGGIPGMQYTGRRSW